MPVPFATLAAKTITCLPVPTFATNQHDYVPTDLPTLQSVPKRHTPHRQVVAATTTHAGGPIPQSPKSLHLVVATWLGRCVLKLKADKRPNACALPLLTTPRNAIASASSLARSRLSEHLISENPPSSSMSNKNNPRKKSKSHIFLLDTTMRGHFS